ncbi:XRE family transcriptional regulator, partial [Chloroflexota bacterium]
HLSIENCVSFLGPLIESWDIDLETFSMEIVLNNRVVSEHIKKLEFVEKEPEQLLKEEPGFKKFLRDKLLSGDASEEEIAFLRKLRFETKRPTPLYYYRELQNLRDPLHFRTR